MLYAVGKINGRVRHYNVSTEDEVLMQLKLGEIFFQVDTPIAGIVRGYNDILPDKPQIIPKSFTMKEFYMLFTKEERLRLLDSDDDTIRDFRFLISMDDTIYINEPYIIDGINQAKELSILTAERANEILNKEI